MTKGVGIHNQDPSAPVALTQWQDNGRAVPEALDACNALADFTPDMNVLIKPNLVEYLPKVNFSPFGIITTAVVLESLVAYFKDAGAKSITIGEAALENKEFGCGTKSTYRALGFDRLTARYGVELMDFNDQEFEKVDIGGFSLKLSKPAREADFFVNLPVLKTHEQTKITLGFKNNKGCLTTTSKSICHHRKRPLDDYVSALGETLYPNLTLIDGIYSLENGPMHMGKAHRENLIIASRDMFAADCLGSHLMGIDPAKVGHLASFAQRHGRSLSVEDLTVKGLDPAAHVHPIDYMDMDDPWYTGADVTPKFFSKYGVKGWRQPHPGQTLCTGCSLLFPLAVLFAITASKISGGKPFDDYELLGGKNTQPSGKANKTFLLGDCINALHKNNPAIKEAIPIKGCPASFKAMVETLNAHGVHFDGPKTLAYYFDNKAKAYAKEEGAYCLEHYQFPETA